MTLAWSLGCPDKTVCLCQVAAAPARKTLAPRQDAEAPGNLLTDLNSHAKQIQPCHCKKSMCLKLYCDCFASGQAMLCSAGPCCALPGTQPPCSSACAMHASAGLSPLSLQGRYRRCRQEPPLLLQ